MKRFIVFPQIILFSAFWVITSTTVSNPPPVVSVAPHVDEQYLPGHDRPASMYCEVYIPPNYEYKYCSLHNNIHIIVKGTAIYRTYVFMDKSGKLNIGQLINEWGKPSGAFYSTYGALTVYWPGRFAGLFANTHFSPNSMVSFIGYGPPIQENYDQWRGFINNYVTKPGE
jgi:hypothetical protein